MLNFGAHKDISAHAEDISDYTHHAGTQYGSNPGGLHTSPSGERHYVKFYKNPEQAQAEVTSARVYEKMGVGTVNPRLVTHSGRLGVASKWRTDLNDVTHNHYEHASEGMKHELAKHFVAGVITKNWDTVGAEYDNLKQHANGKLHCVDLGGSLHFRAQGGPKAFTPDAEEHSTYRNRAINPQAHHAFKSLTNDHLKRAFDEIKASHTDADIHHIFSKSGLPNASHMADTMIARREALGAKINSALTSG